MSKKFFLYLGLFVLILFFVFRNLILNISTDLLDWRDYPYIIWVIYQSVTHISNIDFVNFFESNAFYPNKLTLLLSDLLLPQAFILTPFLLISKKLILSFNLLFLATFILNFISSYLFWKQIFKKEFLAFVGSLLFVFSPFFHLELSHFQMLNFWPFLFCLFFLFKNYEQIDEQPRVKNPRFPSESSFLIHFIRGLKSHGFREIGNKKYLFLSGLFLVIQFLASVYLAIYLIFIILIFYLLKILSNEKRSAVFFEGMIIFLIFFAGAGVFIKGYLETKSIYNVKRDIEEYITYSAHLSDYIFTSQIKSIIHQSSLMQIWNKADKNWSIHSSFPGFGLFALSLLGLFNISRDKKIITISTWLNREKSFFLILVMTGFVFSLGPRLNFNGNYAHIPLPYSAVIKFIPVAETLRVPSRWSFIFFLGMTYLALLGIKKFQSKSYYKLLISVLFVLFILEYLPINIKSHTEVYVTENDHKLAQVCKDNKKVLLKIPVTHLDVAPDIITGLNYIAKAELASTYHRCLMINGYSGYDLPALFKLKDNINDAIAKQDTKTFLNLIKANNVSLVEFNPNLFIKELREAGNEFIKNLAHEPYLTKIGNNLFLLQIRQ